MRYLLLLAFFLIFFLDQSYLSSKSTRIVLPIKIYKYAQVNKIGPIFNIPFTIRDGIRNVGYPHGIWLSNTQLIHKQPIYSIYAGRISDDIFNFYSNNYFFGTLDRIINNKADLQVIASLDSELLEKSLNFFAIKNILLKTDENYSLLLSQKLVGLGFNRVMEDSKYILYSRNLKPGNEILTANFNNPQDDFVLFDGWYNPEIGYRWTHGKVTRAIFKIHKKRPFVLSIKAEAIVKPQKMKVFVGKKLIGEMVIADGKAKVYRLNLKENLETGLNIITFKFAHAYKLGKLTGNKDDLREISLNVKELALQEEK